MHLTFHGLICLVLEKTDRVFGPATTTRGVYDAAAQHVVSGAMEGVNGNLFFVSGHIVFLLHLQSISACQFRGP